MSDFQTIYTVKSAVRERGILCLALAQTIIWAGLYYSFPALLVTWEMDLQWTKPDLTMAITIAMLSSALASPFAGRLIDAGRGSLMMTASTAMGCLLLFLLSFVETRWQFYAVWGAIGVAFSGCLYEPCFALVTRAKGRQAKQGIVLITLVAGFASAISFPVMHLLSDAFGWRLSVQLVALVVCAVGTPLIWVGATCVEQTAVKPAEYLGSTSTEPVKIPLFAQDPIFWLLAIGFGLAGMVHGMTLHHLLPVLHERGVSPGLAVLVASTIGPMQVVGRVVMASSEKYVSNHGVAMGCFISMGLSLVFLSQAGAMPVWLFVFVALFGGGYGVVSIVRPLSARGILGGAHFGAKSGSLALVYLSCVAVSPYVGAVLWSIGGYDFVLALLPLIAACGFGLYLAAYKLSNPG